MPGGGFFAPEHLQAALRNGTLQPRVVDGMVERALLPPSLCMAT